MFIIIKLNKKKFTAATYRFRKRLAIRIVVAAWSLAALLLVNYYNSLYISFLTINVKHPLIQSIHELQAHPEIRLVTDKNRNTEALLLVNRLNKSKIKRNLSYRLFMRY